MHSPAVRQFNTIAKCLGIAPPEAAAATAPAVPANTGSARALTRFTLLEVVVALAILGLALGSGLTIVGGARDRIIRGQQRWAREHVLSQATEYFLLAGADADLPEGVLPQGFAAQCQVEVVEDLAEHAVEPIHGWNLLRLHVEVRDLDGTVVGQRTVETMGRDDDPL